MSTPSWPVQPTAIPAHSRIVHTYPHTDLADAYTVRLPAQASNDPEVLARFMFSQQAPWVAWLMRLRDGLVGRLGIKTSVQLQNAAPGERGPRIGLFKIYEIHADEIVLGENDTHLDFRVSLLLQTRPVADGVADSAAARYAVLSTVVHCHNRLGRAYLALIAPFHRQVVRSALHRAAQRGWTAAT